MPTVTIPNLEDLLAQARRLRFAERGREQRYTTERLAHVAIYVRVTLALCALASAGFGLLQTYQPGFYEFPGLAQQLNMVRFGGTVLLWAGGFLATFHPSFPRWADPFNGVVLTLSCWLFALYAWLMFLAEPDTSPTNMLTTSVVIILVVGAFALPMRFLTFVLAVTASVAGTVGWFHATLDGRPGPATSLLWADLLLFTMGLLLALAGWFREAADRRSFAHREHAHALAAELAQTNRELVRLGAEQQEFMTIAAHDLRAPLATVRGFAELLRDGRLADTAARQRALDQIQQQTARMLGLVTDYLDARASATAPWPVQCAPVDLHRELHAAAERHEVLAQQKRQRVRVEAEGPAVPATADPALLTQVLDNFVTNAVKFSPPGATIWLRARSDGATARAEVRDEGPGIAPEEQARLFRLFGRGSARPTGGESSHGIGLAVARRLAEAMHGTVGCDSAAGRGATFWIELPGASSPVRV